MSGVLRVVRVIERVTEVELVHLEMLVKLITEQDVDKRVVACLVLAEPSPSMSILQVGLFELGAQPQLADCSSSLVEQ